ncbi:restriction endonuclease [Actinomadura logoneensis]|uniref:restriction endonuclease n=1 Tax=Actinomadura logoneensis TaxID=2293572 RepID=UPI0011C18E18|nr:restriction endonuclease [Actinomadura logoneensis]
MDAAIIRAGGVDLTHIIQACDEAGIDETVIIGSAFADQLIERPVPAIVIGVLRPTTLDDVDNSDPNSDKSLTLTNFEVLLRVGRALEKGAATCLVVPPPLRPPKGISSLTVISSPVDDFESLRLHLWALTAAQSREDSQSSSQEPDKRYIDQNYFLQSLREISRGNDPGRRAMQTEQLAGELLRAAGVAFAEHSEMSAGDRGYDLAVLPDRLSGDITYIQIKAGRLDERRLHDEELRLREAVLRRHCQYGVLIYHDADGRKLPSKRATPLVVRIALEDLIHRLGNKDFRRILSEELAEAAERDLIW